MGTIFGNYSNAKTSKASNPFNGFTAEHLFDEFTSIMVRINRGQNTTDDLRAVGIISLLAAKETMKALGQEAVIEENWDLAIGTIASLGLEE